MSPTAQTVPDRPETANYESMSSGESLSRRVQDFTRSVEKSVMHPALLEYFSVAKRDQSRNFSYSIWRDQGFTSAWSTAGVVEWLVESYDLGSSDDELIDYLFEEVVPESVPLEWIAELERYRSAESEDFVLPWNEDPPVDHAGS